MKVTVFIQARMNSTRLPGKVLMDLGGRSVLSHVIERARACGGVERIVVATTEGSVDDAVEKEARACGAECFRGSEQDVLDRFYKAAIAFPSDLYFRITSDCPLLDPKVMEQMLQVWSSKQAADYISNVIKRTFPRGLDAELFSFKTLESAHKNARSPREREHVTPYIHEHPDRFTIIGVENDVDYSRYRWTLDTTEDYHLLSIVFDELYQSGEIFSTESVLKLFDERPGLFQLNAHVEQKK